MLRICYCTQLQPILGGCKRCQLSTEFNQSFRSKGYLRSHLNIVDPLGKSTTEQEQKIPEFQSSIEQSRQRSFDCQLRESRSNSEASILRRSTTLANKCPELYSNMSYQFVESSDLCSGRHLPLKRIPIKSTWVERLKKLLYDEPKGSMNEEVFVCQDAKLSGNGLFACSNNIGTNTTHIKDKPEENNATESKLEKSLKETNLDAAECEPVYTFISTSVTESSNRKPKPVNETQVRQRPSNKRCTGNEHTKNSQTLSENQCGNNTEEKVKSNRFLYLNRSGESEVKPKAQKQDPNKPAAFCCRVKSVPVEKEFSSSKPVKKSDKLSDKASPKTAGIRKFCQTSSLSIKPSAHPSNNAVIESYIKAKRSSTKDNSSYNKLKATDGYNDSKSKSHSISLPLQPKRREEIKNKEYIADTNKLFNTVKKKSSEWWGTQPPSKKFEEALEDLRRWEKCVSCRNSTKATLPLQKEDLETVSKYANQMQKRNNLRNQQQSSKNLENDNRKNESECIDFHHTITSKCSDINCETIAENKCCDSLGNGFLDINTKDELLNSRQPECNRSKEMQQNEKKHLLGLNNKNTKSFQESWHKHLQNMRQKADNNQLTKKQSDEANQALKRKLQVETLKKIRNANDSQTDIDYINNEVSQIDNIIKHCELLKSKYKRRLQSKCAQSLQQKFKRNNNELHKAYSLLQQKCMESIGKQKECNIKTLGAPQKQHKCNKTSIWHVNVGEQKSHKDASKTQNKDANLKLCQAAKERVEQLDKKRHEMTVKKQDADTKNKTWEAVLWKRCKAAEQKIKQAQLMKKCQLEAEQQQSKETDSHCKEQELRKSKKLVIQQKSAEIQRMYEEAKKMVEELKQELAKSFEKHQLKNKCHQRDKKTDSTDDDNNGLNKFISSPCHRHDTGIFRTPSIFPNGSTLLGLQNSRGRVGAGGLLDALGYPFTRRLDGKFYLYDLQTRLAHADNSQQQVQRYQKPNEEEDVEESQGESLIIRWVRKFAELPLQLRPGSKILLPLPHFKGSYLIDESETHSTKKWPDFTVDQEYEYDDSDY